MEEAGVWVAEGDSDGEEDTATDADGAPDTALILLRKLIHRRLSRKKSISPGKRNI